MHGFSRVSSDAYHLHMACSFPEAPVKGRADCLNVGVAVAKPVVRTTSSSLQYKMSDNVASGL
jgi:hypothetical protein